jgi:hypothetical protein
MLEQEAAECDRAGTIRLAGLVDGGGNRGNDAAQR